MNKKAQVTIFIIIALLIVGSIILIIILRSNYEPTKLVDINPDQVEYFTNSLIKTTALDCLKKIGEQGGYYNTPYELSSQESSNIPYWYYEGTNIQPLIKDVNDELDKCIENELKNKSSRIIQTFGNSVEIRAENIKSISKINKQEITAAIYLPITIENQDAKSTITDFKAVYNINFLDLYEKASGIVNYASTANFDKCNPAKCSGDHIEFSFYNEGDDLIIKGQTFIILENETRENYELKFAIKRNIKEAFGANKNKMAVLYQEDNDLPTHGEKTKELLGNILGPNQEIDYYDCEGVEDFILRINDYDIVMITGNLQYQIIKRNFLDSISGENKEGASEFPPEEGGTLLYGCDAFNPAERKKVLKNWVNNGGILWINNVGKAETDNFVISYIGSLGYKGGKWNHLGFTLAKEALVSALKKVMQEDHKQIKSYEITSKNILLTCPHNLEREFNSVGYYNSLEVTNEDEIIIGNKENAILWTRKLGKGAIVFDEFALTDNMYVDLGYNDHIDSKGIAENYFVNVLNYITKFDDIREENKIKLLSPINEQEITAPNFEFNSQLRNATYKIILTDISGNEFTNLLQDQTVNITETEWENLAPQRYEWQITGTSDNQIYYSNIDSFIKSNQTQ